MAKIVPARLKLDQTRRDLSEAVTIIWQEALHFRAGHYPDWWGAVATVYNGRAFTLEHLQLPCGKFIRKYEVYEGFVSVIASEARIDPEVFRLALDICASAKFLKQPLPVEIEAIAVNFEAGLLREPRGPGRPPKNFRRDLTLLTLTELLEEKLDIHPTHREQGQRGIRPRKTLISASALIADIFEEVGVTRHSVREETAMRTRANKRAKAALSRAFEQRSPEFHRLCEERANRLAQVKSISEQ